MTLAIAVGTKPIGQEAGRTCTSLYPRSANFLGSPVPSGHVEVAYSAWRADG
jgi:hypothetical protein